MITVFIIAKAAIAVHANHLLLVCLNHCIIPYVMLDENATMRLATPRSTIAAGVIATAKDA